MDNFKVWFEAEHAWHATKDQILSMWQSLRDDLPLHAAPIPSNHKGSTYGQDVIRITGTAQFIGSILSRLKEFLRFNGPSTSIETIYKQVVDKNKVPVPGKFVCFIKVKQKGLETPKTTKSKIKLPKLPKPKK